MATRRHSIDVDTALCLRIALNTIQEDNDKQTVSNFNLNNQVLAQIIQKLKGVSEVLGCC